MYERIDKKDERVKRLERIVKDNDIDTGLAINTKQNGSGLKRLALESIKEIGGNEAIEGLKGLISDPDINQGLKTYASNLLEVLLDDAKNKEIHRASIQGLIRTNS